MMDREQFSNQERIWYIVALIPKGKVASYGLIADLAGLPKRSRFVSTALRKAPTEMQLPWYRIVNAQGKISLAKDSPLYEKQWDLLSADNIEVVKGKVDLSRYIWKPDLAELLFILPF